MIIRHNYSRFALQTTESTRGDWSEHTMEYLAVFCVVCGTFSPTQPSEPWTDLTPSDYLMVSAFMCI